MKCEQVEVLTVPEKSVVWEVAVEIQHGTAVPVERHGLECGGLEELVSLVLECCVATQCKQRRAWR